MGSKSELDLLLPNHQDGYHDRRNETINRKLIEIGKGKYQDFFVGCSLVKCEIRILCGAGSVNLIQSTFEDCVFRPKRELSNLRLTGLALRRCVFLGRYTGCRFGNENEDDDSDIRDCDFSQASRFHLCDFLDGVDVGSLQWPPWPHLVVTDLPRSAPAWLSLKLPKELHSVQEVIGEESSSRAVSLFLPAETDRYGKLRELLAAQSYIATGPEEPQRIPGRNAQDSPRKR